MASRPDPGPAPVSRRSLVLTVSLAAVAGLALIPVAPLALRDRLPDPLATHWGGGGTADGHASFGANLGFLLGLWMVFCAVALLCGWTAWGRRSVRAWTAGLLGFGAGMTAGVLATMLRANLDRSTWRDAGTIGWPVVALLIAGSAAIGLACSLLGRIGPERGPEAAPAPEDAPRIALGARERTVWIGYVRSTWMVVLGGVLLVGGSIGTLLALLLPGSLVPGSTPAIAAACLPLTGAVGLALSFVRVTVDARGLAVAFGPFGRPVRRIKLDRISLAWAEDRSPAQAGGWGYRINGLGTTVMLRGGECLVVRHGDGRDFAVSVDDAERAAAVLNSLRERSAA
ncbi:MULTISPECIES: DUF1648 domain-containing protein [Actinomadura]|uniref:DUF1648 domain-containing protein n=1 Tax=Actinomadura yumaensis TaxID=111807 RepID=A0ABW2CZX6_9ACTN|nr:DUF1648 domain-containing protein [Actinomadura sp. J1-007]MWK32934.1 DUF1648 domain-containing protein [Actinomadura sp. J1-007]